MLSDTYPDVRRYDHAVISRGDRTGLTPCAVQPRDVELIDAVRRHKFLTTPQLLELWWPRAAPQVGRRRLTRLHDAGHLDRFRPLAPRGSYPWTYQLGREGHRMLQAAGLIGPGQRHTTREVYDYRYVLHEIHLNSWMLAWRRLLPDPPVAWHGETLIDPPAALRSSQLRLDEHLSVEGLKDTKPKQLRPDDVLELTRRDSPGARTFLIEYDRTRRVDKNFEKFRRYDAFLCWWWRHTHHGDRDEVPWIIFICQDEQQRSLFLQAADRELTGHHWAPSANPTDHDFVGRRRVLFATEHDMHRGETIAWRIPAFPRGHRGRHQDAAPRAIRLPGAGDEQTQLVA